MEEVLFEDVRYEPPVPITTRLIELAGMTDRQKSIYELDAVGTKLGEAAAILGIPKHAVRNARPLVRSRMKNVLREEGLIEDTVPVGRHRVLPAVESGGLVPEARRRAILLYGLDETWSR